MPWEVSALTVAVGKRVIVAGAARASRVRAIVERADRAAVVADTYAVDRTPERYLVFLAGKKEFGTWYGGESDWVSGFAVAATAGRTDVVINIDGVSGEDLDFVLRHELTHASTLQGSDYDDEDSSSWLIEGIAEQAGYHGLPVPPAVLWTEARRYIRENKWAGDLDPLGYEDDEPKWQITAKYDIGFLAVRRLTEKYGRARVRTFFDAVVHQGQYHEQAARSAFGVGWEAIGKDVGRYVKRKVGHDALAACAPPVTWWVPRNGLTVGGVRRVPLALLLGAVTLVTLGAASCGDEESPIALADAGRGSVAEVVDAPATVTARAAATLTAPADGTLASMSVEPGDTVRKGQVLAVIDSPDARKRLRDAQAALDAARRAGGGFGGGSSGLSRVQDATDKAAADAFEAARGAAGKVAEPALRKALLAQVTAAEKHYASASAAAQDAVGAVQPGRGRPELRDERAVRGAATPGQAGVRPGEVHSGRPDAAGADRGRGAARRHRLAVGRGGPTSRRCSAPPGRDLAAAAPAAAGPRRPAPAAGVDGSVPVGGRVTAGTPVLTIVDVSALGLVAEVDETDVLLVEPGLAATVELDAATGASYDARCGRSTCCRRVDPRRGGLPGAARAVDRPVRRRRRRADAPAGDERGRPAAGARGGRRGDRAGGGGVLRRRPRRRLGGPRRQGGAGRGDGRRAGRGPGADRAAACRPGSGSWCAAPTRCGSARNCGDRGGRRRPDLRAGRGLRARAARGLADDRATATTWRSSARRAPASRR